MAARQQLAGEGYCPLRSRLTLGDSYTNGDVFDGINFRGAQLASDDNMLPDSQKGLLR